MRHRRRLWLLLLLVPVICGCRFGVTGFSSTHDRVAIIADITELYTTDPSGGDVVEIDASFYPGIDVSFDLFGRRLLFAKYFGKEGVLKLCMCSPRGSDRECPVSIPEAGVGSAEKDFAFATFLPSGDILLVANIMIREEPAEYQLTMRVYRRDGSIVMDEPVDQFFPTRNAYKVSRLGELWYLKPYDLERGQRSLRWVTIVGDTVTLYTADSSGITPSRVGQRIDRVLLELIEERNELDSTSGSVSPDGTTLVFRTQTGSVYGLFVVDLQTGHYAPLVTGADFPIQYDFAPDSGEIVYESNVDGRSVWIANADGSNQRKLADNASMPQWHEQP